MMENGNEDVLITGNAELGIRIEFIHLPSSFEQNPEQWMLQESYSDDKPLALFSNIDNHVSFGHIFRYELLFIHAGMPTGILFSASSFLSGLLTFPGSGENCKLVALFIYIYILEVRMLSIVIAVKAESMEQRI